MILVMCLMSVVTDGYKHSMYLEGYAQTFGAQYVVDFTADAARHEVEGAYSMRNVYIYKSECRKE